MEINKILNVINKYDLILFDFDNTIFETQKIHDKAYSLADLTQSGDRYEKKCKEYIKLIETETINIIDITLLIYLYCTFLGKKKAIVSATLPENVMTLLRTSEVRLEFDKIYCGGRLEKEKNKPNAFMHICAMDYFNISNEKTLILEDSNTGFLAAKNANIDCFDVNNLCFYYNA